MFFIWELLRPNPSACDRLLARSFPPHRVWDRSLLPVWGLPQARGRMEVCMELLSHGSWSRRGQDMAPGGIQHCQPQRWLNSAFLLFFLGFPKKILRIFSLRFPDSTPSPTQ